MNKKNILIIDDDDLFLESISLEINDTDFLNALTINGSKDFKSIKDHSFDLILIDLRLKNESGLNLIQEAKSIWPNALIYLMTGFGTISTAVSAIKLGASDYLTKPITIEKVSNLLNTENLYRTYLGQRKR